MKMKRSILASMIAAVLMLTACGGSDDAPQNPPVETNELLGRWHAVAEGWEGSDVYVTYNFVVGQNNAVTFEYRMWMNGGNALHNAYDLTGTYVQNGNQIVASYTNRTQIDPHDGSTESWREYAATVTYTYRIENGTLYLSGDDTNGQHFTDLVFTKR